MKKVFLGLVAVLVGFFWISCSKDGGNAVLQVRLTDAPADYDQVLVDVQNVQIHASSDESKGSWQSLEVRKGVYNLLDFRNGMDTLLGSIELPAGKVSQMRLVLGTNNKIVKDGQEYMLDTPSALQSGLKFNIHAELVEGVTYKLWIDFDAARSIVAKGNGGFSLKPVIRPFTEATSGAIKGVVNPVNAATSVMAVANGDTIGTVASEDGRFLLRGLAAGSYRVILEPSGKPVKTVENVSVELGKATDMGTVNVE